MTTTLVSDLTVEELVALIRKTVKEVLEEHEQTNKPAHEINSHPVERFSIYDLLKLPEAEQQRVMEEAVNTAMNEDYEILEANEFLEENQDVV